MWLEIQTKSRFRARGCLTFFFSIKERTIYKIVSLASLCKSIYFSISLPRMLLVTKKTLYKKTYTLWKKLNYLIKYRYISTWLESYTGLWKVKFGRNWVSEYRAISAGPCENGETIIHRAGRQDVRRVKEKRRKKNWDANVDGSMFRQPLSTRRHFARINVSLGRKRFLSCSQFFLDTVSAGYGVPLSPPRPRLAGMKSIWT